MLIKAILLLLSLKLYLILWVRIDRSVIIVKKEVVLFWKCKIILTLI